MLGHCLTPGLLLSPIGKQAITEALAPPYPPSCTPCTSSCATFASTADNINLPFALPAPSISCSLLRSSLFCLSSCCRALSFFWAALRSVASSLLSCSAWGGG